MNGRAAAHRARSAFVGAAFAGALIGLTGCDTTPKGPVDNTPSTLSQLQADAENVSIAAAEAELAAGRYTQAHDDFARLLAGDATNVRARLGLAETLLAAGNYADALAVFKSVPDNAGYRDRVLQGEGMALMQLGQLDAGGELLLQSVRDNPNLWQSWNGLGQYYDAKQQWPSAQSAYDRAFQLSHGAPIVLNNQGMSMMLQKRYAE